VIFGEFHIKMVWQLVVHCFIKIFFLREKVESLRIFRILCIWAEIIDKLLQKERKILTITIQFKLANKRVQEDILILLRSNIRDLNAVGRMCHLLDNLI